jgi:hypothetical protein
MNFLRSIAMGALVPAGLFLTLKVHVEPDQNNVTAGRLAGQWVTDGVVAGRMGLASGTESIEFTEDSSFLSTLPQGTSEQLQQEHIYECGVMVSRKDGRFVFSAPYLLTSRSGNPHQLMLHESNGVPLGGIESTNLFVAPGHERKQDILFMGGAVNSGAFRPFHRSNTEADSKGN